MYISFLTSLSCSEKYSIDVRSINIYLFECDRKVKCEDDTKRPAIVELLPPFAVI